VGGPARKSWRRTNYFLAGGPDINKMLLGVVIVLIVRGVRRIKLPGKHLDNVLALLTFAQVPPLLGG